MAARAENRAAAAQLAAIGELFAYRLSRCSETEDWAVDTMDGGGRRGGRGVADQPGAGRRPGCTMPGRCASGCRKVGEVFAAGEIDYRTFATIVYRTDLITDDRRCWPAWMRSWPPT